MKSRMTGEDFKRIRLNLGFKRRRDIAEVMGVGVTAVQKWEAGKRSIPLYAARKLRELWAGVK